MIRVAAAVIEREGKILIARRRGNVPHGGLWEFPGGKIERNETPEECLERELREELNIEAKPHLFLCSSTHDDGGVVLELLTYRVVSFQGEIKVREHAEIRWVTLSELGRFQFPPVDTAVIKKLQEESPET